MLEVSKDKPVRNRLNVDQKRALKTSTIRQFVQVYRAPPPKGGMACERLKDKNLQGKINRMSAEVLDCILREDDD